MTHDQVYRISPRVGFVIHVHCPALWTQAETLGIPATDTAIEYGTPAMAAAVGRLFEAARTTLPAVFSMGGHEDGMVCFGTEGASAGALLLDLLGKVREQPG
jgi:ribulose-5-phosphate 4-epimerase/fuculose-1-phosphate aldolase